MFKTSGSVLGVLLAVLGAGVARAEPGVVEVTVTNIRNARGHIDVQLCDRAHFANKDGCALHARAPAQVGTVTVRVPGVAPGTYAAEVFQDEDDSGEVTQNFLGIPTEGIGFSRDAPIRLSPPSYDDAAFGVGPGGGRITLRLRYF